MVLQIYVSGNFSDACGRESGIETVLALRDGSSALLGVSIYASRARATLQVEAVDETLESNESSFESKRMFAAKMTNFSAR
jgi:hypothetical protein